MNEIALTLLLSLCDTSTYKKYCEESMYICFTEKIERTKDAQRSFRECYDDNFEKFLDRTK